MILTNEEMDRVRQSIEAQAGLDSELMRRCGHLIHLGAFDEAVRSAFVLLEERLKKATGKEGMTGTVLANHAFSKDGPLAKHLARSASEQEGLRELYSGAFKLFRNPTAHGVTGYDTIEGKAIIGFVNLLLEILKRAEELPPLDRFPDNVEKALGRMERTIGAGAANRLRVFLGKCIGADIYPKTSPKYEIAFRRYALFKQDWWDKPKRHRIPMFHLMAGARNPGLRFPSGYYRRVVDFNVDRLVEDLVELEFRPSGKSREPYIDLRTHSAQGFFDALFDLVERTSEELEEILQEA